jgi:hypothetical protein
MTIEIAQKVVDEVEQVRGGKRYDDETQLHQQVGEFCAALLIIDSRTAHEVIDHIRLRASQARRDGEDSGVVESLHLLHSQLKMRWDNERVRNTASKSI